MTSSSNDPAMTDCVWAGYHPRAMAPLVVLITFVSLLVWTGQWYLDDISNLAAELGAWATFAIAWGVWPALMIVFLYRTVTFTYRLTDRAVIADFGPLCYPVEPITLNSLDCVEVGGGWLTRLLGVGFVDMRVGGRVLRMKGVWNPDAFAAEIRAATMAAQQTKQTK